MSADFEDEDTDSPLVRWMADQDEKEQARDKRLTFDDFSYPQSGLIGRLVRRMPPYPDKYTNRYVIDFYHWYTVKKYIKPRHFVGALLMLLGVMLSLPLIYRLPLMDLSVVKLVSSLFRVVTGEGWGAAFSWRHFTLSDYLSLGFGLPLWARPIGIGILAYFGRYFIERIPVRAMWEEQVFRQGSESWSKSQVARACMLFGLAHVMNLIYPVGIILLLMVGGYIFTRFYMWQHKKSGDAIQSTIEAATLHTIYNTFACGFAILYMGINVLL